MNQLLMSINPQHIRNIMLGNKIIELRKTKVKLEPPFTVYMYCTKSGKELRANIGKQQYELEGWPNKLGKLVGQFTCYDVEEIDQRRMMYGLDEISDSDLAREACVDLDFIISYKGDKRFIYAYHIRDVVIYNNVKELNELLKPCIWPEQPYCPDCPHGTVILPEWVETWVDAQGCSCDWQCSIGHITTPPQSMCYTKGFIR